MALRDQPYLPLYVQDFLTDEKLMECSASATGIYIRIMCIMHKSEEYGVILLKQKDKQTDKQINNFALKFVKFLPYSTEEIIMGLGELINEGVLQVEGDRLLQKRMIKDNAISIVRADAGKKGGEKTQFAKAKSVAKAKAKHKANAEYEYENEDESVYGNKNEIPPQLQFVKKYCEDRKNGIDADYFINWYAVRGWKSGKADIIDWQACIRTWENKNKKEQKLIMPA